MAKLSAPKRLILNVLRERGPMTASDVAMLLDYERADGARVHLDAMVKAGVVLVKQATERTKGQIYGPPPKIYRATPTDPTSCGSK